MDTPIRYQRSGQSSNCSDTPSPHDCHDHSGAPQTEPNAGSGDPTDGRGSFEWQSRYPPQAIKEIRWESWYLFALLILSLFLIFAIWQGWISTWLNVSTAKAITLKKYLYYTASGMLGGVAFGIKYFYRVVARGFWHQDRRIWRLMSPFLALTIGFIVGAMIEANLITAGKLRSGAAIVSTGFLSGYFADKAVAKMYEIADVLFGKSASMKAGDGKY